MQETTNELTPSIKVTHRWSTPNAENNVLLMARVSSKHRDSTNTRLINYLIKEGHWSPLEMANFCVEIEGPRAILRQILRHRSFSFQEFSQRYASVETELVTHPARRQDLKNRQNSIDDLPSEIKDEWIVRQNVLNSMIKENYEWALDNGIAKECARVILPEGNTTSILCMNGNLRSWIHYLQLRDGNGTQFEHMKIAKTIKKLFIKEFPVISKALEFTF